LGVGHAHALYIHEHSALHRLAPPAKLLATFGLVVCVAVTPREAVWAFAVYAAIILLLSRVGRVPLTFLLARLVAVLPFVVFALFIPFIAGGETTTVAGLELSVPGLWGAWNIFAKAILGASASIVLTATTEVPDLLRGLGVLKVPAVFTSIAVFMIRYLELIADELGRMRVAMTARGYDPRWLSQVKPIAGSAGALFVRSYERGERIHSAMLARGFTGVMPLSGVVRPGRRDWWAAALLMTVCAAVAITAMVTQ
jgi:cobalt/nickel transport system permease protein